MTTWKEIVDAIKKPITPYQHSLPSHVGEVTQFEEGQLDEGRDPNKVMGPEKPKEQSKKKSKKKKKKTKGKKK